MDSSGSKTPEPIRIEGSTTKLTKPNLKNTSFQAGIKHTDYWQSGLSGFMSVPFEGPISDEILFANEMPRAVHWSVAWADVMMTMFIIFAALYIFKAPAKETVAVPQVVKTEYIYRTDNTPRDDGNVQSQGEQSIQDIYDLSRQTLSSTSSVELVPDKAVRIILKSDLLFDLGKAYIKEDAKASLREVAEVLRQTGYMVNVVGHTDDLPINTEEFPSNWELSTARACEVARFLMKDMNIPEEKFYVTGHAFYQPVKPNTDEINRAVNRRVEIIITKERPYGVNQEVQ
jgi:outer membrane protein OmpA-like peptidoglycan-associated protein